LYCFGDRMQNHAHSSESDRRFVGVTGRVSFRLIADWIARVRRPVLVLGRLVPET
jgi:hypothetical protein